MKLYTMIIAAAFLILHLVIPTFAEIVTVGDYDVEVDFNGSTVNITQHIPYMVSGFTAIAAGFVTENAKGTLTICESPMGEAHSILVSNCDRILELIMKQEYINVDVTPYEDGFFATGEDQNRIPVYGLLKPEDVEFGRASQLLIAIAASENEEVSKQIITSARIA